MHADNMTGFYTDLILQLHEFGSTSVLLNIKLLELKNGLMCHSFKGTSGRNANVKIENKKDDTGMHMGLHCLEVITKSALRSQRASRSGHPWG